MRSEADNHRPLRRPPWDRHLAFTPLICTSSVYLPMPSIVRPSILSPTKKGHLSEGFPMTASSVGTRRRWPPPGATKGQLLSVEGEETCVAGFKLLAVRMKTESLTPSPS
ncbi:unnamed protein product [Caenorhabditis auriculariae]|uniref:Uncharacterized protein n=1 Tax=Caenorhabditis auriculariae TaxID=2777116 RepID=A0A8S1HCL9_9PELO|nr:unnamed protein product [Caenorhabditis auriculariae]